MVVEDGVAAEDDRGHVSPGIDSPVARATDGLRSAWDHLPIINQCDHAARETYKG